MCNEAHNLHTLSPMKEPPVLLNRWISGPQSQRGCGDKEEILATRGSHRQMSHQFPVPNSFSLDDIYDPHLQMLCIFCMLSIRSLEFLAIDSCVRWRWTVGHQGRSHGNITRAMLRLIALTVPSLQVCHIWKAKEHDNKCRWWWMWSLVIFMFVPCIDSIVNTFIVPSDAHISACCAGVQFTARLHNRLICHYNIDCVCTDEHRKKPYL